jgi:hypothetical protein
MINLSGIAHENAPKVWPDVLPWIKRALEYSADYTADGLLERIQNRDCQLWIGHERSTIAYVGVTQLDFYPDVDKLVCLILLLAGDGFADWRQQALAEIESWAIVTGAREIRLHGRPGWERVLAPDGFSKSKVVLTKSLGGMQ